MNETKRSYIFFVCFALMITVWRIIYLFLNHRDLDIEEAQYWAWSHHLALGYHSKPPMISWLIHFSTGLFGDSEWAIRVFSPILYFVSSLFILATGKNLYHARIGIWAAIIFLLAPGVTYSSTIISTDPLLILFWSIALYTFAQAMIQKQNTLRWWIGCGIAIGLGLLSKYTMLVFFLSALVYGVFSAQNRGHLWRQPGPYLALVIALGIFSPNIIWNLNHHNAALAHVVNHNIEWHEWQFHGADLMTFIISQFGLFNPILMIVFIFFLFMKRKFSEPEKLLLCFSLPMLVLILVEALLARAYANWAAVTYPAVTILVAAYLIENQRTIFPAPSSRDLFAGSRAPRADLGPAIKSRDDEIGNFRILTLKVSNILNIIFLLFFCCSELAIAHNIINWPNKPSPTWQQAGNMIQQWHAIHPDSQFLVDSRELWSRSLYYAKIPDKNMFVWQAANWFDGNTDLMSQRGKNFILLTQDPVLSYEMIHSFKHYQFLSNIAVNQRFRKTQNKIYIFWMQNFLGS